MTAIIALAVIATAFTALFYMARKAGVDKAENAANKEAIHDILEATRPATAVELEHVRKSWRRD
jgi:Na+-translocating ferredoxin:NAD+ oxidoreductase RnfG subunit